MKYEHICRTVSRSTEAGGTGRSNSHSPLIDSVAERRRWGRQCCWGKKNRIGIHVVDTGIDKSLG
jgi:hypothetical protein